MKPPAIGYLRRDISGVSETWDEIQIRTLTRRLGYERTKTVVFSEMTADPIGQLVSAVERGGVDAVVVPSLDHLGGEIPESLVRVAEVITVSPEAAYARRVPSIFDPTPDQPSEGVLHAVDRRSDPDRARRADRRGGLPDREHDHPMT